MIPRLLVVFTRQLEILVKTLLGCFFFSATLSLLSFAENIIIPYSIACRSWFPCPPSLDNPPIPGAGTFVLCRIKPPFFSKRNYIKKNCIQKRDFLTGPQHKNNKCATNVVSLCAATSGFYDTNLNTLKYNTYIHYSPFVISSLIMYDRHKEVPALQTT